MPSYTPNFYGDYTDIADYLGNLSKVVTPGFMPKTLKAFPSRELGCGSYGCAYRARKKGWVIKVTTDLLEADLAEMVSRQRGKAASAGMVKFGGVVRLADTLGTFVIWREEAKRVGDLLSRDKASLRALEPYEHRVPNFMDLRESRSDIRKILKNRKSNKYKKAMATAMAEASAFDGFPERLQEFPVWGSNWLQISNRIPIADNLARRITGRSSSPAIEASAGLAASEIDLKLLEVATQKKIKWALPLKGVIKTLRWLAARGLYLADMHDENCGYVMRNGKRTLVLTDPRMLVLRERHPKIKVVREDD